MDAPKLNSEYWKISSMCRELREDNDRLRNYAEECRKWIRDTVENCSVFSDPPQEIDLGPNLATNARINKPSSDNKNGTSNCKS